MPEIHPSILVAAVTGLIVLAAWIGRMTEFKSTTTKLLERLEDKIDRILGFLPSDLISGESPLRLTPRGQEISEELDAPPPE